MKVGVKTGKIAPTFGEEVPRRAVQWQCLPQVGVKTVKNTPTFGRGFRPVLQERAGLQGLALSDRMNY